MQSLSEIEVKRFDFFSLRDFAAGKNEQDDTIEIPHIIEEAPPPPPPPPTFSEAQMEYAKTQAREEGIQHGIEEGIQRAKKADAERESHLTGIMKQACEKMTAFRADYAQHVETHQESLTRLALAVAWQVAGSALKQAPQTAVANMVAECLPLLLAEPRVVITVHPSIITLMKDKLEEVGRQSGYDGTLILEPDETLHPADCHIQWRGGSAHSSLEETWRTIEEKLLQITTNR